MAGRWDADVCLRRTDGGVLRGPRKDSKTTVEGPPGRRQGPSWRHFDYYLTFPQSQIAPDDAKQPSRKVHLANERPNFDVQARAKGQMGGFRVLGIQVITYENVQAHESHPKGGAACLCRMSALCVDE